MARGEISTVPARLLPAASAPMDAAADAMVSPPEVDAATGSPSKKKKKRKVLLHSFRTARQALRLSGLLPTWTSGIFASGR